MRKEKQGGESRGQRTHGLAMCARNAWLLPALVTLPARLKPFLTQSPADSGRLVHGGAFDNAFYLFTGTVFSQIVCPPGDCPALQLLALFGSPTPNSKLVHPIDSHLTSAPQLQVRHVGGLFGLRPNPELSFDSAVLPYADLCATISDIVLESSEQITEHYSPPGTADALARAAKRKQERGWNVNESEAAPLLPEADLVAFSVGGFSSLLVEAAVLGCLLWHVEQRVQKEFGYALESRSAREEHNDGSDTKAAA
jgi:hypothetical protein